MGLDMYLNKRTYVGNNYKDKDQQLVIKHPVIRQGRVVEIVEQVGYWRKANAIHNWFVQNVQEGQDDCKEYYVSKKDLERLLEVVERVLKASKLVKGKVHNGTRYSNGKKEEIYEDGKIIKDSSVAEELLPTTEGFFFGGTQYDEYYIQDLEYTRDLLKELIKEDGDFYYQSSW